MDQNYNLSWDLYQESNEEILNKSITVSTSSYNRTFNTGFKASDFDKIKIEVSGKLNFYTRKINNYGFWYKYNTLSDSLDGGYMNTSIYMYNSGQYATVGPGSNAVYETTSPRTNSYWKNMTVSLPSRNTSYISTAGINMPIQGSAIIEFPNPIPNNLKGQRAQMYFQLNHQAEITHMYHIDQYETTTETTAGGVAQLYVTWNADGNITLSQDNVDSSITPTPRNSVTWTIKITGHMVKKIS